MDSGMNAAEAVLLADRNNCNGFGFGGEMGFMWIFALLLLPSMWGGGAWGNNRGNAVTEADLCNANSFNELKGSVGRLNDQVNGVNVNLGNAICNLGYETLRNFNNLENIISRCCCEIQRAIDSVNYNISQSTASINANTTEKIQKVLDWLCAEKAGAQAQRINQFELQQALCGVVRCPSSTTYNAGYNPFCNNGYNGYNGNCGNRCCA